MMIPKLLHVVVQPMFVLVDTDTLEVSPAPGLQATAVAAADIANIPQLLDMARLALVEHAEAVLTPDGSADGDDAG